MSFFRRSPPRAQTTPSSQRHVLKGRRARRGSALRHPSPRQHNALAFGLRWKHSEPSSPFVRYSRLFSHSQENTGTPQHTRGFPLKAESSRTPSLLALGPCAYQPLLESRPQLPRVPRVTVSPIGCARKGRRPSQDAPNRTRDAPEMHPRCTRDAPEMRRIAPEEAPLRPSRAS
jgi:hypothetical protein